MKSNIADIVLKQGVVYTADDRDTLCEAVAIKGSRILFAGSNAAVHDYIGQQTQVIDLQGKMVVPGFIDTHMHPPGLALSELYEVQLFAAGSIEEYVAAVQDFIDKHPGLTTVYGRGWSWGAFSGEELIKGPRKEYLDAVSQEIPIILRAKDGHSLWVNSKALAVNGITEATPAPEGGSIEKDDASGQLWGTLKEAATWLIAQPQYSLAQYIAAMEAFQQKLHSFGITGVVCMGTLYLPLLLQACMQLEQQRQLALHIRGAATVSPKTDLTQQFAAIQQLRQQYASSKIGITTAKFFTDGVVEGATSHLLQPYAAAAGKGPEYYGTFLWDQDKLREAFARANGQGLQICVHSTGDASTRKVLDALAKVQKTIPPGDYRNTITHLQVVDQQDILRFKDLKVIASVQPYWHFKGPNWWQSVDYRILGERAQREYPLGSFFANEVVVTSSSDYPATLAPNPVLAIDTGVTRNIDDGNFYGVEDITDMDDERYLLHKAERATVRQMLRSFTINAAYAMFMEQETGSIEAGKLADLAVLEQNLLEINPVAIDKVKVAMTFFEGTLVYNRS